MFRVRFRVRVRIRVRLGENEKAHPEYADPKSIAATIKLFKI
jgi:hypothetical protein